MGNVPFGAIDSAHAPIEDPSDALLLRAFNWSGDQPEPNAINWEAVSMARPRWLTRTAVIAGAVVTAGAIGAFLFAWSGIYNVGASAGHWAITRWFLEFGMRNAVETHALGINTPKLDDPADFFKGLQHYEGECALCHGSPADARNAIALQMLPVPPLLAQKVSDWTPAQLFWIVKHGLKYTGMPGWPALSRDDEVWAMTAFLIRLPELTKQEYRRLVRGELAAMSAEERARQIVRFGSIGESLLACGRCHGLLGEGGGAGAFPRLAGQKEEYLYKSLYSYATGARPSGVMQPVADGLDENEMRALAEYFARAKAPPSATPVSVEPSLLQLGGSIAAAGVPEQGVPSCGPCHGGPGHSASPLPLYPVLAGQHAAYLELQLRLWRAGVRGGTGAAGIMVAVAAGLSDEQIRAVSLYYASLR